jgi:hypothetical protein
VRCSLLALSSYIDNELDHEPSGELEAHLVACDRCRTAIGHLREESARIGGLARVHVPDDAVHELFSQIGLIAEEDELPEGPVHRDRPAPVEAPPWFGAERGAALPWAPRPTAHDPSQPRELMGERSPVTAVAEPPELLLWDETIDQIDTAVPEPPPVHVVRSSEPLAAPDVEVDAVDDNETYPIAYLEPEPIAHQEPSPTSYADRSFSDPQPPAFNAAVPQPPDLSTSAPMVAPPRLATGPNAFQRLRDAVAVRFALRRGGDADFDSGVEIVSGVGAPRWDQRTRPRHWNDSQPIVVTAPVPTAVTPPAPAVTTADAVDASAPAIVEPPSSHSAAKPNPLSRFMARITALRPVDDVEDPVPDAHGIDSHLVSADPDAIPRDDARAAGNTATATPPPELADVLSEVASLAAPLERTQTPASNGTYAAPESWMDEKPAARTFEYRGAGAAPTLDPEPDTAGFDEEEETRFGVPSGPATAPPPGRHLRRLQSQRSDRRDWNPAQPVTGRHVLPLGGPAVGAADRDRRLWLFGAVTIVLMLLGLLIGKQVTQTKLPVAATLPKATAPAVQATAPPSVASLPVATPAVAPTAIIPSSPTPQQLTAAKTLGTGGSGFSVADVRYGEHPNDFRLVFDMAFPDTVSGDPTTVIGYDGPTTLYVEFNGVAGASNIATIPAHQVVMSVDALPMARNTNRLIFKITLSKNAPFDAYYLSGTRLVIDIT